MSSVSYDLIDNQWVLMTPFGVLYFATEEEALMTLRNFDYTVKLQSATEQFYAAFKSLDVLMDQWDQVYSLIMTEEELGTTSVIASLDGEVSTRLNTIIQARAVLTSIKAEFEASGIYLVMLSSVSEV